MKQKFLRLPVQFSQRMSRQIFLPCNSVGVAEIKGDLDGVLADYNRAIQLNPRFADAWFNRAAWRQRKGEWARAEADFTEYIALKPRHADAYCSRGIVRLRQGRADEAQQDFEQCLKLNPELRQSLERMIAEAKGQGARNPQ